MNFQNCCKDVLCIIFSKLDTMDKLHVSIMCKRFWKFLGHDSELRLCRKLNCKLGRNKITLQEYVTYAIQYNKLSWIKKYFRNCYKMPNMEMYRECALYNRVEILKYFFEQERRMWPVQRIVSSEIINIAAYNGHLDMIKFMVEYSTTHVNCNYALLVSVFRCKIDCMLYLLEFGTITDFDKCLEGLKNLNPDKRGTGIFAYSYTQVKSHKKYLIKVLELHKQIHKKQFFLDELQRKNEINFQ